MIIYVFRLNFGLADELFFIFFRIGSSDPIGRVECGYNRKGEQAPQHHRDGKTVLWIQQN